MAMVLDEISKEMSIKGTRNLKADSWDSPNFKSGRERKPAEETKM